MIAGPFTDQGLLIARDHYERLGGHAPNASPSRSNGCFAGSAAPR